MSLMSLSLITAHFVMIALPWSNKYSPLPSIEKNFIKNDKIVVVKLIKPNT